jgi:hypothetical protein
LSFQPYRTSYSRHVYSLWRNGFYTRSLDADDYWFIERIRHSGSIGGNSLGDLLKDNRGFGIYDTEIDSREAYNLWEDTATDPTYYALEDDAALDERALGRQEMALKTAVWEHRRVVREEQAEAVAERKAKRRAEFERQWLQRQATQKLEQEVLAQEYRAWEHAQERIALERAERLQKTAIADLEWEAAEKKHTLKVSARQRYELEEAERGLELLASAVKKLNRKVKRDEHRERHRRHPRKDDGNLEAGRREKDNYLRGAASYWTGPGDSRNAKG